LWDRWHEGGLIWDDDKQYESRGHSTRRGAGNTKRKSRPILFKGAGENSIEDDHRWYDFGGDLPKREGATFASERVKTKGKLAENWTQQTTIAMPFGGQSCMLKGSSRKKSNPRGEVQGALQSRVVKTITFKDLQQQSQVIVKTCQLRLRNREKRGGGFFPGSQQDAVSTNSVLR